MQVDMNSTGYIRNQLLLLLAPLFALFWLPVKVLRHRNIKGSVQDFKAVSGGIRKEIIDSCFFSMLLIKYETI